MKAAVIAALKELNKVLTDYKIARILGVHQSYITRRKRLDGCTPRYLQYKCLIQLLQITLKHSKYFNDRSKDCQERIQSEYQRFITSPMYSMLKEGSSIRRPSHSGA